MPAVATCLTSAFFDDPLWGRWAFPEQTARSEGLYELMSFWASAAVRYPWVRMTEGAEAVAVWIPPGKPELSPQEQTRFTTLVDRLFGPRARELHDLFDLFEEHHPRDPSYYLSLWATHRDHAGRGIGTALIEDNLARIDAAGASAYLESTNPANIARYEALGFAPAGDFGPVGGPVIRTMLRAARG